ncbi:MAG: NADH:ubiquinone oxidoreductase [Euryarchaeota archaeon]|nr:NADH:ubiquinone oxidoreductase [Euryarchaeota archaeon]
MVDVLKKSIWVFHINSGSCNGCDIEVLDVFTPRPDFERFGVKLVPSPRHADAIALTGPITRAMVPKVVEAIKALPEPKIVLAIGACACGGGIWHDTYVVVGGIDEFYKILKEEYGMDPPTTIYIPGCPAKPEALIYAAGILADIIKQKQRRREDVIREEDEEKRKIETIIREEIGSRHFLPKIIVKRGPREGSV